jgi:hypothetical protein
MLLIPSFLEDATFCMMCYADFFHCMQDDIFKVSQERFDAAVAYLHASIEIEKKQCHKH